MIRLVFVLTLILCSPTITAQNLYKWVEPDGSITFSTNPPKSGTAYEKVISNDAAAASTQQNDRVTPTVKPSKSTSSTTSTVIQRPTVTSSQSEVQGALSTNSDVQATTSVTTQRNSSITPTAPINAMQATKQSHCQDLKKRVVSLERRLRTLLNPEDMDNTVVHMARYQRSFDQHCVQ